MKVGHVYQAGRCLACGHWVGSGPFDCPAFQVAGEAVNEELVKAVAARLGNISGPIFGDREPWPKWDLVAREALRLMEWSRASLAKQLDHDCQTTPLVGDGWKRWLLSLPPDDWTP